MLDGLRISLEQRRWFPSQIPGRRLILLAWLRGRRFGRGSLFRVGSSAADVGEVTRVGVEIAVLGVLQKFGDNGISGCVTVVVWLLLLRLILVVLASMLALVPVGCTSSISASLWSWAGLRADLSRPKRLRKLDLDDWCFGGFKGTFSMASPLALTYSFGRGRLAGAGRAVGRLKLVWPKSV